MKSIKLISVLTLAISFFLTLHLATAAGLTDFKGNAKAIEDFTGKGKWVLVMFWASDCHICNKEAHQYVDFHMVHSDEDAIVLGVSIDGKDRFKEAENFIKKHNIDFPNLIGEPTDVITEYSKHAQQRWVGTPSFLLFNPKGEILAAQAGAVPPEVVENFMKKHSKVAVSK